MRKRSEKRKKQLVPRYVVAIIFQMSRIGPGRQVLLGVKRNGSHPGPLVLPGRPLARHRGRWENSIRAAKNVLLKKTGFTAGEGRLVARLEVREHYRDKNKVTGIVDCVMFEKWSGSIAADPKEFSRLDWKTPRDLPCKILRSGQRLWLLELPMSGRLKILTLGASIDHNQVIDVSTASFRQNGSERAH